MFLSVLQSTDENLRIPTIPVYFVYKFSTIWYQLLYFVVEVSRFLDSLHILISSSFSVDFIADVFLSLRLKSHLVWRKINKTWYLAAVIRVRWDLLQIAFLNKVNTKAYLVNVHIVYVARKPRVTSNILWTVISLISHRKNMYFVFG